MFVWIKYAQSIGGVKHASVYGTSSTRCVAALERKALSVRGGLHSDGALSTSGSDGMAPISDSIFENDCTVLEEPGRAWGCLAAGVL